MSLQIDIFSRSKPAGRYINSLRLPQQFFCWSLIELNEFSKPKARLCHSLIRRLINYFFLSICTKSLHYAIGHEPVVVFAFAVLTWLIERKIDLFFPHWTSWRLVRTNEQRSNKVQLSRSSSQANVVASPTTDTTRQKSHQRECAVFRFSSCDFKLDTDAFRFRIFHNITNSQHIHQPSSSRNFPLVMHLWLLLSKVKP